MYFSGWLTAIVAILVVGLTSGGPAVAVLVIGPICLLLAVRLTLDRPAASGTPAQPKSVDIEANRIRSFQESLDERGTQRDH